MTHSFKALILGLLILPFVASSGLAEQPIQGSSLAAISFVSERTALVPGETNWIALTFLIERDWHLYWKNAGDTGQPPSQKWNVPDGVTVGEPLWPVPHRHVSPGTLLDYIFENELVLLFPIMLDESFKHGDSVTLAVESDFLICDDICLFGDGKAQITLPVAGKAADAGHAAIFLRTRTQIPRPEEMADELHISTGWENGSLRLTVPGARGLEFFPHRGEGIANARELIESGETAGSTLRIPFELGEDATEAAGVLTITMQRQTIHQEIRVPVPGSETHD